MTDDHFETAEANAPLSKLQGLCGLFPVVCYPDSRAYLEIPSTTGATGCRQWMEAMSMIVGGRGDQKSKAGESETEHSEFYSHGQNRKMVFAGHGGAGQKSDASKLETDRYQVLC
jgi:hypothetical protein